MRAFLAFAVLLLAAPPALAGHRPLDCIWDDAYDVCVYTYAGETFQRCWGVDVRVGDVTHQEHACAPWFHPCEWGGCPIKIEDLPGLP